jgi:hypothetical protein
LAKNVQQKTIPAIRVRQWLKGWDDVEFSSKEHRSKPLPHFFLFSLNAAELRKLCGIVRRQAANLTPRAADLGIQRQHDLERSKEIGQFVEFGYPWSTLSKSKRQTNDYHDLRKPGWLPTAIVINVLRGGDVRSGSKVDPSDVVTITEDGENCEIVLPYEKNPIDWRPSAVPPLEVIDGQHRLWAFTGDSDDNFELPVVAFYGLDASWQAYLFWTINIKPKRINPSLAFDLYPLLRAEDWLDRAEGHPVYRETRSQELTEALWSHPQSPWYDRINMLGERQNSWVTQSAWIKTLMATFVRAWTGRGSSSGGLFGSRLRDGQDVLGWSRAQQAAFLIFAWQELRSAIRASNETWARDLRGRAGQPATNVPADDAAFYGSFSLIVTDQGVRGFLHSLNDLCFSAATHLNLRSWQQDGAASDSNAVSLAITSISKQPVASFLRDIGQGLASFDWRTSATPDLSEDERKAKLVFRGSSGYKEIRRELLKHLKGRDDEVGKAAAKVA